ncbi:MAG: hypothetical protein FJ271_26240 [Planctomycetes bacterium]|nr:hypothetical protein [Planctomycetota bacterium]
MTLERAADVVLAVEDRPAAVDLDAFQERRDVLRIRICAGESSLPPSPVIRTSPMVRDHEDSHAKGEVDIVRVTQARTSLIQLRRTYLDSVNELAQAAAALSAASGLPPAAFVGIAVSRSPSKTRAD